MFLIEPCCAPKHVSVLRSRIAENGTVLWHGYGDLSMVELLPAVLSHYSEADVTLVMPTVPDTVAEVLLYWLRKQWMRADGQGKLDVVGKLTLISDLREQKSPVASRWLQTNPYPDRLTLRNVQQNDTAIILPDMAYYGNINLTYGRHFTAIATKNASTIDGLRDMYEKMR